MPTPTTTSSARSALETCLKNRARIADQLAQVTERTNEFNALNRKRANAARRLDQLVSSEAATVAAWSNGDADASRFDVKGRATLEAELKTAITSADDARKAAEPFLNALASLHNQKRQADLDVDVAKAHVLLEEIGPEIAALEADAQQFYRKVVEVDQAVDFINGMARHIGKLDTNTPDVDLVRSILLGLEKARERVVLAVDRHRAPACQSNIASRLTSLTSALGLEAAAQLEVS